MLTRSTISRARDAGAALDQQRLYSLGLDHVRRLARRVWTDHNVHDPGITTLELLCYALTDLSYRASFPVEDLFAGADESGSTFFTARRILPNRPLTELDYRKLLIDLKGVKNAWIAGAETVLWADPVAETLLRDDPHRPGVGKVSLRGLYKVFVEFMDDVSIAEEADVMGSVTATLQANRNLCENFVEVLPVPHQGFVFCAELEVAPDADVSRVEAEVLFRVREYLSPPVRNYSLSEMLARRKPDGDLYTAPEIFDGPRLECGFFDDAELARARLDEDREIRLSDVVNLVMDVEGVRAVGRVLVRPEGSEEALENRWLVPVAKGMLPVLVLEKCRIVYSKRGMPVLADPERVLARYEELADEARRLVETPHPYDLPVPAGRDRGIVAYTSFQNHFPAIYGLGEVGLPAGASAKRNAQADQLKAYLLFFDQVMADYCAQLARVGDLLSADPDLERTCFHQLVTSLAGFEMIYGEGVSAETLGEGEEAAAIAHRNRLLDHLVARFAERFHDYAAIMLTALGATPESLIAVKGRFLRRYPELGAERGLAWDASLRGGGDLWDTGNVSGFERRVASLLGIYNIRRRSLSAFPWDEFIGIETAADGKLFFRLRHRQTGEILLTGTLRHATADQAREGAQAAVRAAQKPERVERRFASNNTYYFNVLNDTGVVVARRLQYFATREQMDAAIQQLMTYLREHYSEEGLFLIESLLLLPPAGDGGPFLPICSDPNCADCAEKDPYSYRLHAVLPAWAGRFADMDFRRFAEEVIRQECPAHLLPKVCWIDRDDMIELEAAWRGWLEARDRNTLATLIHVLYNVRNVYPSERLRPCKAGDEKPKFILGRTALGSAGTGDGE